MVVQQIPLQRLADVLVQMETVCNLNRLRCADPRAFGIGPRTVPADDFDLRMPNQPRSQGLRRAVWQEVNDLVGLEVHQDGAVILAAPFAPVIHPEHAHRDHLRHRHPSYQSQQRARTNDQRFGATVARSSLSAQIYTMSLHRPPLTLRSSRPWQGQLGQTLSKHTLRTPWYPTAKAPHPQADRHCLPGARTVGQCSPIMAVHMARSPPTARTSPKPTLCGGRHLDNTCGRPDPLHLEPPQTWKQQLAQHRSALSPTGNKPLGSLAYARAA